MGDENYPFRGDDAATRKQADFVLRSITPMVRQRVNAMNRLDLSAEMLDQIHSNTMVHLWQNALPEFNKSFGFKPSTFLYRCAVRFIITEYRRLGEQAKSKRRMQNISPEVAAEYPDSSQFLDSRIEKLADDIIRHPSEYMTQTHANVLLARISHPDMPIKDLAKLLGYRHSRSLSTVLSRIRQVIMDLEIEPYAAGATGESDARSATSHPHATSCTPTQRGRARRN